MASNGLINCSELTCEWVDCGETFTDRLKYLSHITRTHVASFGENQKCLWNGCEQFEFSLMESFQLHLSMHATHQQCMHNGYKLMTSSKPELNCYMDSSSRNIIADPANVLLCGWDNCNGEFFDYELFTNHVDTHAMEDVTIPVMAKEKLKKLKFAKCGWVSCNAAFNSKSHLKSHLMSHTQKKVVACPVCGMSFCTRSGFFNHCYRQETPTSIENFHITNFEDDLEEEPEGILTIDEDANPSSIVIHLPQNLQKIIPSQAIIDHSNGELNIAPGHSHSSVTSNATNNSLVESNSNHLQLSTSCDLKEADQSFSSLANENSAQVVRLPNQNVALLVNLDSYNLANSNQNSSEIVQGDISASATSSSNLIQLSLASAEPAEDIDREFRCLLCPKSFSTRSLLREHTTKHIRKYLCPHCTYAAPYPARLKEHILFRHSQNREFGCMFCEHKCKTKYALRRHILLHNANEEQHCCEICQQTFTNYYSLNRHVRLNHLKEQIIFACHLCKKEYNRGNNLSRHLTTTHKLEPAAGWARFVYEKQQDGVFRLKGNLTTQEPSTNNNTVPT